MTAYICGMMILCFMRVRCIREATNWWKVKLGRLSLLVVEHAVHGDRLVGVELVQW